MSHRVRTAVLPAAGFGTRMLPETLAVPKELLPVGGKPAIQWALDEASDAGIDRFIIVSSRLKPAIETYLLGRFEETVPVHASSWLGRADSRSTHIEVVYQPVARGLGDAVRVARSAVGNEPFIVLLPDEILLGGSRLLRVMIDDFEHTGRSGVSLLRVPQEEISAYGCAEIAPGHCGDERLLVTGCIEKPRSGAAPSCFALSGRYVLGPELFDLLDGVEPDARGEVQLTQALHRAAASTPLAGFVVRETDGRTDIGNLGGMARREHSSLFEQ
jgi:UTP--glucose-1-phosphate uridylyltransferase